MSDIITFDIESTNIHEIKQAVMYLWSCTINGHTIYGRTWFEWVKLLRMIDKEYHTFKQGVLIWIHNFAFEQTFMSAYEDMSDKVFATNAHRPIYSLENDFDRFTFRCSLMLTNQSLDSLTAEFEEHKQKGFDYIALGHIHKNNFEDNEDFVYPGSTISFGFDELGEHGVVVIEIDSTSLTKEFVKFDNRQFDEVIVDVDSFNSKEDLIEYVLDMNLKKENMYKLILVGKRNFEIVPREIIKYLEAKNIIKIKDCTKLSYDLEELAKENNLKGIFVRKVLEKAPKEDLTEEEIAKIIEIGLESME